MSQIRKLCQKDVPKVMDLLVQVCMVHHNGRPDLFNGPATKYTPEEVEAMIGDDRRPVYVYTDEKDRVLGYAFCIIQQHVNEPVMTDIRTLYIDDLCVDEHSRGQHIGKALYEHVLMEAKAMGCHNVTLNVWACNASAMAFYESCGLQIQKIGMEKILE